MANDPLSRLASAIGLLSHDDEMQRMAALRGTTTLLGRHGLDWRIVGDIVAAHVRATQGGRAAHASAPPPPPPPPPRPEPGPAQAGDDPFGFARTKRDDAMGARARQAYERHQPQGDRDPRADGAQRPRPGERRTKPGADPLGRSAGTHWNPASSARRHRPHVPAEPERISGIDVPGEIIGRVVLLNETGGTLSFDIDDSDEVYGPLEAMGPGVAESVRRAAGRRVVARTVRARTHGESPRVISVEPLD